jgi:hypothetical protein
MKILVNKDQREINFKKHVSAIIQRAQFKAQNGIDVFAYPIPTEESISPNDLINKVSLETEDTVYGGYGCVYDGFIRFNIKTN